MNKLQIISSGIVKNNPTFVLVLGMCPTLGTTTSAENGMGMGLEIGRASCRERVCGMV